MNISLYDTPAFQGLRDVAAELKTDFFLTGAAASRLAITATFFEERLEVTDAVDLAPFMETIELEVTNRNLDLNLAMAAIEANVAWCDLTNVVVRHREGPGAAHRAALPLLRTEVGPDGFQDPDHVIDKSQDGVVQFESSTAASPEAAARALALSADLYGFFQRASLTEDASETLRNLPLAIRPTAEGFATVRWLKASAGRFGAEFGRFLADERLAEPLSAFGQAAGASWLTDIINGRTRVLSPNLSQTHEGAWISLISTLGLPAGFSDHFDLVNATRESLGGERIGFSQLQDAIEPLPAFAVVGGRGVGLIEIATPVEDDVNRDARHVGLDAVLFVLDGRNLKDVALATLPIAIAGGVSDRSRRAIMRTSAEPLATVADSAPLIFRPFLVKHNPDTQITPPPTKRSRLPKEASRVEERREEKSKDKEKAVGALVHKAKA